MAAEPFKPACLHASIISGQPSCIQAQEDLSIFIIGTYQLEENASDNTQNGEHQNRSGSLELYHLENDGNATLIQSLALASTNGRSSGAILDMAFCPLPEHKRLLAICTSTGLVSFVLLSQSASGKQYLDLLHSIPYFAEDVIITSISWTTVNDEQSQKVSSRLAVSLADGRVAILQPQIPQVFDSGTLEQELRPHWIQHIHQESAWTARWGLSEDETLKETGQSLLLTGGDDATIHAIRLQMRGDGIAIRKAIEEEAEDKALHTIDVGQARLPPTEEHRYDAKTHQAGVTAILPLGKMGIVTGSYDGRIRLLNPTLGRVWANYADLDLGGGIWQITHLGTFEAIGESIKVLLLVSCMHTGTKIVELIFAAKAREDCPSFSILASFEEHESMCYASIGIKLYTAPHTYRVVSTSFYDKKLCVWDFVWYPQGQ